MLASLTFVTPRGGLLALAVVVPLAAFAVSAVRISRGRALLRLGPPSSDRHIALAALVSIPLLLGLAAAGPAWRTHAGRRIRTDAQAVFIFDTSRSMAAAASFGAPTRFAQARAVALQLRGSAIPEVPSGVASLTTQLLPHLFPTANEAAFNSTVEKTIGVEKPPPPALELGLTGTSFRPLNGLRDQGYFDPATAHRFAILLTDGESAQVDVDVLAQALTQTNATQTSNAFGGQRGSVRQPEAPVTLFVVRLGGVHDHIYDAEGNIEVGYRPDSRAAVIVETLATAVGGHSYTAADLSAASAGLRKAVGSGTSSLQGARSKTITLAPYVVLAAFAPLALLIRRRNLTAI